MKALIVVASLCGMAMAGQYAVAPAVAPAAVGYAAVGPAQIHEQTYAAGPAVAHTVPAGPPVHQVHETYHAGQPIVNKQIQHGVVGHRTVQVGSQAVQVGHEYFVADQKVTQPAPYSFVAGEAVNTQHTVPIAPPALPVAAPVAYATPPRPVNLGPAPADTVTQERVLAPARAHQIVTPRLTRVEPELHVNKYPVDVPVHVPVPVHRDVVVEKRVERPYEVAVPRAVPVPKPYKVHPVHEVVQTPVIHEHTVSEHYTAPVAVAHQGYVAAAPAIAAAPVAVAAEYAAAPALAAVAVEKKY